MKDGERSFVHQFFALVARQYFGGYIHCGDDALNIRRNNTERRVLKDRLIEFHQMFVTNLSLFDRADIAAGDGQSIAKFYVPDIASMYFVAGEVQ